VHSDAQTYLENLFKTRWTADTVVHGGVGEVPLKAPTQFENVDFEDSQFDYVYRPIISFGPNKNIGLGAYCQRHEAKLLVHLFHKPGSGMAVAMKACDDIVLYFTNKTYSIYEFKEPTIRKIPVDQDGWVQSIVTCPFEFDIWS
jgi:hypothetical protein